MSAFSFSDLLHLQHADKPIDYSVLRSGQPPVAMKAPGPAPLGWTLADALLGTGLRPTSRMLGGMKAPTMSPLALLRSRSLPNGQDYDALLQQLELMRNR